MPRTRCLRLFGCFTASALLLVSCAEDKSLLETISAGPTSAPTGNPTGSPTGNPTEGVTDSGTDSGTTGGGKGDCPQYLLCIETVAPESSAEAEAVYGDGGVCWEMEAMEACLEACTWALSGYTAKFPEEPACGGMPASTTGDPTTTTGDPTATTDTSTSTTTDTSTSTTTDTSTSTTTNTSLSTTEPDTDTGGEEYGNCGWDAINMYYACGGVGADPGGVNPIACPPNPPLAGEACGTISEVGCCTPNGDNYYCNAILIAVESCGP